MNDEYYVAVAIWSLMTFCYLRVRVSESSAHQDLSSDFSSIDTLEKNKTRATCASRLARYADAPYMRISADVSTIP